jgi:hypothetical protein
VSKKRQKSAEQRELEDLRLRVDLLRKQVADISQLQPRAKAALRGLSQNVDLLSTRLAQKAEEVERIRPKEAQLERLNVEVNQLSEQLINIAAAGEDDETGKFLREVKKAIATSLVASTITNLLGHVAPLPEVKAEASPKPTIVQEEPLRRQEDHYVRRDTTDRIQEWAELRNENLITQDEFRALERMLLADAYDMWEAQHAASALRKLEKLKNKGAIRQRSFNRLKSILLGHVDPFKTTLLQTTNYTREELSDLEWYDTAQEERRFIWVRPPKYYWPIDVTREERKSLQQELTWEEHTLLLRSESKGQDTRGDWEEGIGRWYSGGPQDMM